MSWKNQQVVHIILAVGNVQALIQVTLCKKNGNFEFLDHGLPSCEILVTPMIISSFNIIVSFNTTAQAPLRHLCEFESNGCILPLKGCKKLDPSDLYKY